MTSPDSSPVPDQPSSGHFDAPTGGDELTAWIHAQALRIARMEFRAADAEDIAQEIADYMDEAIETKRVVVDGPEFMALLRKRVQFAVLDRRKSTQAAAKRDRAWLERTEEKRTLASWMNPGSTVETRELVRDFARAVDTLPKRQQLVAIGRVSDTEFKDLAGELGITERHAKRLASAAFAKLGRILAHHSDREDA